MRTRWISLGAALVAFGGVAAAQTEIGPARVTPNLTGNIDRPLRYRPDHGDFVIENGAEYFNRSLYGGNTAFRVDGGDKPEFVLYLPGRGGNLRLGVAAAGGAKWLQEAAHVETRYRPGELLYVIRDPLLGTAGELRLAALAYHQTEGLIVRAELSGGAAGVELVWANGGVNGERGKRDGDIGTESVPISQWFQLRPEFCRGNAIEITGSGFHLVAKPATIVGAVSADARIGIGDASDWNNLAALVQAAGTGGAPVRGSANAESDAQGGASLPIVVGRVALNRGHPVFLSLQRVEQSDLRDGGTPPTDGGSVRIERGEGSPPTKETGDLATYREVTAAGREDRPPRVVPLAAPFTPTELPTRFAEAERHFAALRDRVSVDTPDPFLNAAVGALNVAADAVWDEPQRAIMHGAIAWRTKLLGWRGPYALDALGRHDHARENFMYWISRQNTDSVRPGAPPPEARFNLSRNETGLHTNGDLSNSHYDMNLVFIDALFRHLQWTGDLRFGKQVWPVIQRHLAGERRLFRREYGPEKLPLYEAYAAIWASDDLQYSGGGTAHASAYNYYENRQAARLARLIGKDPAPYDREADLIGRAMRELLWVTPEVAAREGFDVGAGLPREDRVGGGGAKEGNRGIKPLLQLEEHSSRGVKPLLRPGAGWFAEYKDWLGSQRVHPSAALWTFYHTIDSEVPTSEEAWQMTEYVDAAIPHLPVKGPGVPDGLCTLATSDWMPYDWSINNVVLAEAVHGALAFWEAGRPDEAWAITKGSVLAAMFMGISPGNVGSMSYLDVYRRESQRDFADGGGVLSRALIEGLFGIKPDALAGELHVTPGWPAEWDRVAVHHPDIALEFDRRGQTDTYIVSQRCHPMPDFRGSDVARLVKGGMELGDDPLLSRARPQNQSDSGTYPMADSVAAGDAGFPQPLGMRLKVIAMRDHVAGVTVNGRKGTWRVVEESVGRPRIEIVVPADPSAPTHGNVVTTIRISWSGDAIRERVPKPSSNLFAPVEQGQMRWLMPVIAKRDTKSLPQNAIGGELDLSGASFEPVDLTSAFNDRVTQIFRNEYRSPRSSFVSLALPKQGIGGWAGGMNRTAAIEDTGLRASAARGGGQIVLPNGVPLRTPGDPGARNVVFTSQWDNYPRSATVPLSGRARGVVLLMAGSTDPMQSRFENGDVVVTYADGTTTKLPLINPTNWWPIEQDYFIDDFQFRRPEPLPIRVDLATGRVRVLETRTFKGHGGPVPGGSATVLKVALDPAKPLKLLSVDAVANDVVIGLMAATLVR